MKKVDFLIYTVAIVIELQVCTDNSPCNYTAICIMHGYCFIFNLYYYAACALIVFISPCDCYHFGFSFKYLSGDFNNGDNVAEFGKIRNFNPRQNEISKNSLSKRNKI